MALRSRVVTLTGSSGYLGRLVRPGLEALGHEVRRFDRYRGPLVGLLRGVYFGTWSHPLSVRVARRLRRMLTRLEAALIAGGAIRPTADDILAPRGRLAERFRGCDAVVHLAALPHPDVPGATPEDYRRINLDGAINVFEAARAAGVKRFVFASSAQVYGINRPLRIDSFPILETNHCPTPAEGQTPYGWLKLEFERHLQQACASGSMSAAALRLECPGMRSRSGFNFYISTSVENTVQAFARALEAEFQGALVANVADAQVAEEIVDVQAFLREHWPQVPNHTRGNEGLLGISRAREVLGYAPRLGGSYHDLSILF